MADPLFLFIPLAAAIVVSLMLAGFAWWKSEKKERNLFVLMSFSLAFLSATYWMELYSDTLEEKLFWNDLEYLVNVSLPILFLMYTYTFLGRKAIKRPRNIPLLFIIPALTLVLLWTNNLYHLFYPHVGLTGEPFTSFTHTYGIGFAIHSVYSLGLLLVSVLALAYAYLRSSRMHRRQIMLVLVASLIPIAALVIGLQDAPLSLTYFFVVGFTASAALLFIGSFKFELFDVVPLALEGIVEAVDVGIVVIDPEGRMLFVNDLLLRQAGRSDKEMYARPLSALSPELAEKVKEAREGGAVDVSLPGCGAIYLVKVAPIQDREGSLTSELITLRDITEERRTSERLRLANMKLSLMASITRHDILNQLTIVRSYGEMLARRPAQGETCKAYGQKIASAGESIERQLRFAQDYQSLGEEAPRWQSAKEVVERARALGLGGSLSVTIDLETLELLADPLLDRVFGIFLDNTARHGGRASLANICHHVEGDEVSIVYQDDGVGVAEGEKALIFEKGYGRGGGLGLYIARQILEVSGMQVRENGRPGQGACFEITVPPGRWRAASVPLSAGPS